MGKCPDCGSWDAFAEESRQPHAGHGGVAGLTAAQLEPVPIDAIELESEDRLLTGIAEFDRVLGGGIVPGTLVLIGGDPGIGKSTLMLQALSVSGDPTGIRTRVTGVRGRRPNH